jgi:hypothetical protein
MRYRITRAGALALSLALVALVALGAGGCKGGGASAPDCKAVGAAYASLQRQEIEKPAAAAAAAGQTAGQEAAREKQKALSLIPLVKEAIVAECQQKQWPAETRRCAVEAQTPNDLERCRTRPEPTESKTEAAPAPGAPASAPETATPPVKSDSP